ncbi:MAG: hypothetical protein NXI31_15035 [bacterium]|nr:hypothetical protein [bacterium]
MELTEKEFWNQLRRSVDAAEADTVRELDAAEQLLADIDMDENARLSDARIDELVSMATADSHEAGSHEDPRAEPNGFGVRFGPTRFGRALAAAATLLIAPKFIIAATAVTAVTAVTVTTVVMQYSSTSLPFQDAIATMSDPAQPENERHTSTLRVFADVMESILLIKDVANEGSELSPSAVEVLDRMRSALTTGVPFVPDRFPDGLVFLGDLVADRNLALEERKDALLRLAEQMLHGVGALTATAGADGTTSDRIGRDAADSLRRLARLLAN